MNKIGLIIFLLLANADGFCKELSFLYKREIHGINNEWHRIILPNEIFSRVQPDLSDLRIIGIDRRDTVQIPYFLNIRADKHSVEEESFRIINRSETSDGYYYAFELPLETSINQILPEFSLTNFDWRINLEGSHNLNNWFTIIKDYRISAFHNDSANFHYSKIVFPDSKYRYFRLLVKSKINPELQSVKMQRVETLPGETRNYPYRLIKAVEDKQTKKSIFYLELPDPVPVALIEFSIKDTTGYYRPVEIDYLSDSIQTNNGWNDIYSNLANGIVKSGNNNSVSFAGTILRKMRITITNNDNQPLKVNSFSIKGYVYELVGHFGKYPAYYLVYGNKRLSKPSYDLEHFRNNIPREMTSVVPGKEQTVSSAPARTFFNSSLLWFTMSVVIFLLGWFTVKMIRNKNLNVD